MKKFICMLLLCVSFGALAQDSPGIYTIENVKINTSHSDFGTAFLGKDKVVFAAPRDGFTLNREEYKGQPFLDLHVAEVSEDGKLIRKQKLPGDVNTKYHEGMVTFSKDMKTVYFSANGKIKRVKRKKDKDRDGEVKTKGTANIHLFKASIDENGDWGNLEMLPFNDDRFSTGHPVLNWDDTKLYFVSDTPGSYGKTDIYVVDLYEDGTYGEPINLGPKINTQEREMFPFIGTDNVLYFSSDGFPGMGELDVYASKIFDNTVSEPINLEAPVNSVSDDFAYIIDDHKHKGYFSSNREGGKGDDDIYSFVASPPIYIECEQEITGVVKNIDTQELIPNVTIILFDEDGEKLQSFMSNEADAAFSFMQSCNSNYKIQGFLEGYLVGEMDIQTVNDLNAEPIEIVLNMMVDPNQIPAVIADNTELNDATPEEKDGELSTASQTVDAEDANTSSEAAAAIVSTEATVEKENEKKLVAEDEQDPSNSIATADIDSASELGETATRASSVETSSKTSSNVGKSSVAVAATTAVVASNSEKESATENQTEDVDVAQISETSQVPNSKEEELIDEETVATNSAKTTTPAVIAGAEVQDEHQEILEDNAKTMSDVDASKPVIASDVTQKPNESEVVSTQQEVANVNNDDTIASSETVQPNEALPSVANTEETSSVEKDAEIALASNSKNVTQPDLALNYDQATIDLNGLNINTIYFDFDKDQIRYDAKIELNKLVKVMKEYPEMKIEVNAHTDIRGKKKYNEGLSNKRADATTKYLVDNGVESKRISSYWFGELRPAEKCSKGSPCSGFQHQLNRRSEFSIINKSSDEVIVKSLNRKNTIDQKEDSYTSNSGVFMNYNFYEDTQVYTVQVGAFKGQVQTNKYSKLTNLFNHRYDDGLNRYYSGIFETPTEARNHMKLMRKNGYVGAFVVGLKGEDRF